MTLRITREAAERPKRRKKTQPPPSAEEERLRDKKKHRSRIKEMRKPPREYRC